MAKKNDLLDELLKDVKNPQDIFGEKGLFQELKKAMIERVLEAEMSNHLGYERHKSSNGSGNYRNGKTSKKVITKNDRFEIDIPRDRSGSFEPQLIGKYQRRLPGFDDKIISMYARGMTVREIKSHIEEIYIKPNYMDLIRRRILSLLEILFLLIVILF